MILDAATSPKQLPFFQSASTPQTQLFLLPQHNSAAIGGNVFDTWYHLNKFKWLRLIYRLITLASYMAHYTTGVSRNRCQLKALS